MTTEGSIGGMGSGVPTGVSTILNRMYRAARLDVNLYEEVEADRDATGQAAIVVAATAIAAAIGSQIGGEGLGGLVWGLFRAMATWVIWSYLTYFIGTRFFGGTATPGELLRTLGFASTPGLLNILGFLGGGVGFIAMVWSLAAGFVAIRQALDIDNTKAALTALISGLIAFLPFLILGSIVIAFVAGMMGAQTPVPATR